MSAKSELHMKHPQITEIGTEKICCRTRKKTGKTGNLKIEFGWGPCTLCMQNYIYYTADSSTDSNTDHAKISMWVWVFRGDVKIQMLATTANRCNSFKFSVSMYIGKQVIICKINVDRI